MTVPSRGREPVIRPGRRPRGGRLGRHLTPAQRFASVTLLGSSISCVAASTDVLVPEVALSSASRISDAPEPTSKDVLAAEQAFSAGAGEVRAAARMTATEVTASAGRLDLAVENDARVSAETVVTRDGTLTLARSGPTVGVPDAQRAPARAPRGVTGPSTVEAPAPAPPVKAPALAPPVEAPAAARPAPVEADPPAARPTAVTPTTQVLATAIATGESPVVPDRRNPPPAADATGNAASASTTVIVGGTGGTVVDRRAESTTRAGTSSATADVTIEVNGTRGGTGPDPVGDFHLDLDRDLSN